MRYRSLGSTQLSVSEVGFGCARIGGFFQGSSRKDVLNLLRSALDAGITFYDTADMYTQGESERLLGDAFARQRERVVIATKFGYVLPGQKRLGSRIKPLLKPLVARLGLTAHRVHPRLRGTVSRQDFSADYITTAIEASLRRLKTDYVDVYQLHSPPPDVLERGEFVEPLERLREQGKIRHWGIACEQPDDVLAALRYTALATVQVGFSALEQAPLDCAFPRAGERGVGIIARQVYASGLLTRPIETFSTDQVDDDPLVAERKRTQIAAFAAIAHQRGRTPSELALKFALGRSEVSVVPLGISRPEHLDAALAALDASELTPQELDLLLASRRLGR
jgi:aryl-alcohol dehydrogenase-like predicted oxidoreductase